MAEEKGNKSTVSGILDSETTERSEIPPKKGVVREYAESILVAVILALIIRTFFFQAFKIPSGSMEDTLLIGDHLLVNKFIYGTKIPFTDKKFLKFRDPVRGDVIVFEFPLDTMDKSLAFWQKKDFIKRIVGLPGDKVKMENQVVYVNGQPYKISAEIHKGAGSDASPLIYSFNEITVPANSYFVLGDNRDRSSDSRFWGFVPADNIKGLAFIKYWSIDGSITNVRWNRLFRPIR